MFGRDKLTHEIIGAAIEVHRLLGPGLLESIYESCLCHELQLRHIAFQRQVPVPLMYKGMELDVAYRMDLVVADRIVVEIKTVRTIEAIHEAQLLSYLRLTHLPIGLLINFHTPHLRDGLKRLILTPPTTSPSNS